MLLMKNKTVLLLLGLCVLFLSACNDEDGNLKDVDTSKWEIMDAQDCNGVAFSLVPCTDDEVPCNDFSEDQAVNFMLTITNNLDVPITIMETDIHPVGGMDWALVSVTDEIGNLKTGLYTPHGVFAKMFSVDIYPGEVYSVKSNYTKTLAWHKWPSAKVPVTTDDPRYNWDGRPYVTKGLYKGVAKAGIQIYERVVENDVVFCKELFVANVDLSVNFVVR